MPIGYVMGKNGVWFDECGQLSREDLQERAFVQAPSLRKLDLSQMRLEFDTSQGRLSLVDGSPTLAKAAAALLRAELASQLAKCLDSQTVPCPTPRPRASL